MPVWPIIKAYTDNVNIARLHDVLEDLLLILVDTRRDQNEHADFLVLYHLIMKEFLDILGESYRPRGQGENEPLPLAAPESPYRVCGSQR